MLPKIRSTTAGRQWQKAVRVCETTGPAPQGGHAKGQTARTLVLAHASGSLHALSHVLERMGHHVIAEADPALGLALSAAGSFDLVVLDLDLVGSGGVLFCRDMRGSFSCQTPLMVLLPHHHAVSSAQVLDAGADDIASFFDDREEFQSRVRALLRRSRAFHRHIVVFDQLRHDPTARLIMREGKMLNLSPTTYRLLAILLESAPCIVETDELERRLWGSEIPGRGALRFHVHALRNVLDKPFSAPMLKNQLGIGYQLVGVGREPE